MTQCPSRRDAVTQILSLTSNDRQPTRQLFLTYEWRSPLILDVIFQVQASAVRA